MEIGEEVPVVIDNGSSTVKACSAADKHVRVVLPCSIGNPHSSGLIIGMGQPHPLVGEELIRYRHIVGTIRTPIKDGVVCNYNWDDIEYIWHHIFYNGLRVAPEEHPVLLSETLHNLKALREKTTQIMFETFQTPALYISNTAALSLYSTGRSTGLVVESGHQVSRAIPIHRWHPLSTCAAQLCIAGDELNGYILKLLKEKGYPSFACGVNREVLTDIKEKLCYVSLNADEEALKCDLKRSYELPDGQCIQISDERFRCVEPLFQPKLLGNESEGIHELAHESVLSCDVSVQRHLYGNVLLFGGSTNFPGMSGRFEREISLSNKSPFPIKVRAPPHSKESVCMGGAILSSLSAFKDMAIPKREYDETGPSIVHRKCF